MRVPVDLAVSGPVSAKFAVVRFRLSRRGGLAAGSAGIEGNDGIAVWLRLCEALVLYAVRQDR
jgi:hypothetical protein